MKIWLVTIGEPVPMNEGAIDRLHRTGYFAKFLAAKGHDVIWWTSAFDHFQKKFHVDKDLEINLSDHLCIRLLHGCGYKKNLSFARFKDHYQISRKFRHEIRKVAELPDIIVTALPTIELCKESVDFGEERKIPVVLDMRDMWPDIFVDRLPEISRPFGRILFAPLFRNVKDACSRATSIIGITEGFVDWGLNHAGRNPHKLDRAFYLGYSAESPQEEALQSAEKFWNDLGITDDTSCFNVCYIGNLGHQTDLMTVLKAAQILERRESPIKFIICGSGHRFQEYSNFAADLSNTIMTGWIDHPKIYVLIRRSFVGINTLPDKYDCKVTINNKAIEYLSGGLPIAISPRGTFLGGILATHKCGISYNYGDAEGLATELTELSRNRDAQREMSVNAKNLFLDRFQAEKVYDGLLTHLEAVVNAYQNCEI